MTEKLLTRAAQLKPSTLDEKSRTVRIIAATPNPVTIYDAERGYIPESLQVEGFTLADGRDRVPLLDSHDRSSSRSVVGTVHSLHVEGGQIVGTAEISRAADDLFQKIQDGHITDVSIGYIVEKADYLDNGETRTVSGLEIRGPAKIATRFLIKEISAVPIGADTGATIRGENNMTDKIKEEGRRALPYDENETREQAIRREERERCSEIRAMCVRFELPDLGEKMINDGTSIENAREVVMKRLIAAEPQGRGYRQPGGPELLADESDKRADATIDGLLIRSGIAVDRPAPGAREYANQSLLDIAKECLTARGDRVRGMTRGQIAEKALSMRTMTTSDFPYILANTGNKMLRRVMEQAPSTWAVWCKQGTANDYKEMSRVAVSSAPELLEVHEGEEYSHGSFSEARETFQIGKFGRIVGFSRESIINDDLSAFTATLRAMALKAETKINSTALGILTANAAMSDGKTLFHADHSNYVAGGGGAAPSLTTMKAAILAMRTQTGLASETLNIQPRFILVPAALEENVLILLESTGHTDSEKNAGVINPYYKRLEPIVDATLDGTSATGWYVLADPAAFDTVEVAFLGGPSGRFPTLETQEGFAVDEIQYKVRLEFGAKAIDWRGMYYNAGA